MLLLPAPEMFAKFAKFAKFANFNGNPNAVGPGTRGASAGQGEGVTLKTRRELRSSPPLTANPLSRLDGRGDWWGAHRHDSPESV
jgi:hypothetical protein